MYAKGAYFLFFTPFSKLLGCLIHNTLLVLLGKGSLHEMGSLVGTYIAVNNHVAAKISFLKVVFSNDKSVAAKV